MCTGPAPHVEVGELAQYDLRHKVVHNRPERCLQPVSRMRLSPGGRYLFVCWADQVLQLYDLHRENACVWAHDAKQNMIVDYAFELHKNGSITVLIILLEEEFQYVKVTSDSASTVILL